jgi:hypothetical protein
MAKFWNQSNNYLLGTLVEQVSLGSGLALPLTTTQDITVTLLSGRLPDGVSIDGTSLVGTPAEVIRETEYRFVLRAVKNNELQDHTFRLRVTGADQPEWITEPGLLPVGPQDALFILDNEIIDYQLVVEDSDLLAGDELLFYIEPGNGLLPPGITLTEDGRLTGVVEPLLALDKIASRGGFDTVNYDTYPIDFAIPTTSGFGSFFYDTQPFGFNLPNSLPKKLNRYYEFAVTVADKVSDPVERTFQIYVVGDDFIKDREEDILDAAFEEDSTVTIDPDDLAEQLGGVFAADFTFIRKPIWITPPNLGFIRADNYTIIYLDTLRTNTLAGIVTYFLEDFNPDGSDSVLPPGTELDSSTGEVVGYVPGQPAVTREYKFTVRATRIASGIDTFPSTLRTFTIQVLGEIDSIITWITPSNLGTITTGLTSTLQLTARTTVPDSRLLYRLVSGELPDGLRLSFRGEIIGEASPDASGTFTFSVEAADRFQFSASVREFTLTVERSQGALYSNLYLQPFQRPEKRLAYRNFVGNPAVFPPQDIYRPNDPEFGTQTSIKILAYAGIERAKVDQFVAAAAKNHKRRRYNLGNVKRAVAKRPGTNDIVYELIYVEVVDPAEPESGETQKRFGIKNKQGITADSSAYDEKDAVYNRDFANSEPRRLRNKLSNNTIKADSDAIVINQNNDSLRYISNISNMRDEIEQITVTETIGGSDTQVPAKIEREFTPLWMRTGQDGSLQELGFVTAIPLVYCKPGRGADVLLNVQNALENDEFDFNNLDLDLDRYVLSGSLNNQEDQYILFANYQFNE